MLTRTELTPVMYENQRGLSLWGKTWYSSNSLLPTDPSPFTVPIEPVGGDVMERDAEDAVDDTEGRQKATYIPKFKRKSIKTGYNLETFQTPSPAWVWITPWMVKMRTNTDEQGWRYNLWFHKKGWRSHPGPLNWWGWVRRRAWVRLRGLSPETHDDDSDYGVEVEQEEEEQPLKSFDDIVDTKRPATLIIQHLARFPLDREKQDQWNDWLSNSSQETIGKLRTLLEVPENVRECSLPC